jgi:hypothetical protein
MLRGQPQVEQWGIVSEVHQDDETDPPGVGIDPVRDMVRITEAAIIDPTLDNGADGPSGRVKRKLVHRQELDEVGPIAAVSVESDEGDLHG